MIYPQAVQRPVSAHGGPIGQVLGVVIHVTAGEGDPYWEFANPNNQVSSHFGIGNGQGGMSDGACLTPDHLVLTADLRWVPGGSLQIGDQLVGFDEHPTHKGAARCYRTATVEAVGWAREPVWAVVLDDERVIYTTEDHRWLAYRNQSWVWRQTVSNGRTLAGARVPQVIRPWRQADSFESGWFAGLLDGEGTLTAHTRLGFSQRPTAVLERALAYLDKECIDYTVRPVSGGDCQYVDVGKGGLAERLRILGVHRPTRLLERVDPSAFGQVRRQATEERRVIGVYPVGMREIVKVQTSTRTFIAEGFPMHNCEQYVDTGLDSWAQAAGNGSYLSVETEGQPYEALTNNQILAFASIMVWAHRVYGIPLVKADTPGQWGLILHSDGGAAWGGHYSCPGTIRDSQRNAILYIANLVVNPPKPPSPPPPPPPPNYEEFDMFVCTDPASGHLIGTDANGDFYGATTSYPISPPLVQVGLNQHPEWQAGEAESEGQNPCIGIVSERDGSGTWGYTYITKPTSGVGGWGAYSRYHVNRDGTF